MNESFRMWFYLVCVCWFFLTSPIEVSHITIVEVPQATVLNKGRSELIRHAVNRARLVAGLVIRQELNLVATVGIPM